MDSQALLLIVAFLALLGFGAWAYKQQKAKLLATLTVEFSGGLRFEAYTFAVEMHHTSKRIKITTAQGVMARIPLQGGTEQKHAGMIDMYLPAAGLKVDVAPSPEPKDGAPREGAPGDCDITFSASDVWNPDPQAAATGCATVVRLEHIPEPVAQSFRAFANRMGLWADKITKFAEQDKAQAQRAVQDAAAAAQEEQAQQEAAAKTVNLEETTGTLDLAGQIAKWRRTAGFTGEHSEVGTDDKGGISWFIDLDPRGRITLHSNRRTIFTTLQGASIDALPKALEIRVRDEYWGDGDPLHVFQVLTGSPPDERRAWKERLEAARDRLDITLRKGY